MLRPVSLLPALVAATLAALLLVPVPGAAAAPKQAEETEPLQVTIDSLSPSTLPRRGTVQISGRVTNVDDATWSTVNLYPFVSDGPMTTTTELGLASETATGVDVGSRITDPGPYATIEELAPGESAPYSFSVPRRRIATASYGVACGTAGVYWFGVHALGQGPEGRVDGADGRARTFLPLVPASPRTVDTALVVPVRHAVRHEADGRISDVPRWTRTLADDGQLRRLVDFGAAAGDRPLTWLVDPAVIDSATRLAAGNPARSLAPTIDVTDPEESGSPSPSGEASAEPGDAESDDATEEIDPEDTVTADAAAAATDWLERVPGALDGQEILSLPYGDVDVAGAADHDPAAYHSARQRSGDALAPWGLPTSPVVAPPSGYLAPATLDVTDRATTVLVSDRAFGRRAPTAPTVAHAGDDTLVVTSSEAASGGPGPNDPLSPVAVRQRIVSEAAVRLLTPGRRPLVTVLPADWAPDSSAGFFEGLDLDWLQLTTVGSVSQRAGRDVSADRLVYPDAQRDAELGSPDFAAAASLTAAGDTLQNLLTLNDQVGGQVRDEALTDVSYASRRLPLLSRMSASRSRSWIDQRLRAVTVEAPKAVILSSGSGRFSVTVSNNLDQPVTVRLEAVTDDALSVSVPSRDVEVGPGARSPILLNASSDANGVRNATLLLTDTDGDPIGSSDSLPIRSNQVSRVIWLILGTGVALLFATIVVRLFRRIRAAART